MSKYDARANRIMVLAYLHRYGWIAAMVLGITIWTEQMVWILSACCILFSVWSWIGYKCKWKHIFCSYQNAYREKMTPYSVRWHLVKKSDVYSIFLIFLVLGIAMLWVGVQLLAK